jgi:hypothetical protein
MEFVLLQCKADEAADDRHRDERHNEGVAGG